MAYLVSPAPHTRARASTNNMYIICALLLFGVAAQSAVNDTKSTAILLASCVGACVLTEIVCIFIKYKQFYFRDLSFMVTALALACLMPMGTPWWLAVIAGVIAITSKYVFGGLGNNLFNPAALGCASVMVVTATTNANYFSSGKTVLDYVLSGAKVPYSVTDIFLGKVPALLGGCLVMILVALVVLIVLRYTNWETCLFSLVGYITLVGVLFGLKDIGYMLIAGPFLFCMTFMIVDPTTSPNTFFGRCVYGLIYGVLAAVMLKYNILGEFAPVLAVLIVNIVSAALDNVLHIFHKGVKLQ